MPPHWCGRPSTPCSVSGSGSPGRLLGTLAARDPHSAALRRCLQVTVAGSVGFYLFQYVLHNSQAALYALFGAIALGVLSQPSGPPAQRTRTLLVALAAGIVLVTLGTALAVNIVAASAGMLVIGFLVSFAGVAGPRFAGMANGLQLLYILPSFPPYAPELLGERVLGVVVGVGLLMITDRWLWPIPAPPSYRDRLVVAVEQVAAHLSAVREQLADPAVTAELAQRSADAGRAAAGLRLGKLPLTDRPAAPSRRDRGLRHAAQAVRLIDERVDALSALLATAPPGVGLVACGRGRPPSSRRCVWSAPTSPPAAVHQPRTSSRRRSPSWTPRWSASVPTGRSTFGVSPTSRRCAGGCGWRPRSPRRPDRPAPWCWPPGAGTGCTAA